LSAIAYWEAVALSSSTTTAAISVQPSALAARTVPLPARTIMPSFCTTIGLRWPNWARLDLIVSRFLSPWRRALAGSRWSESSGTARKRRGSAIMGPWSRGRAAARGG
jgi:hypothetical protein